MRVYSMRDVFGAAGSFMQGNVDGLTYESDPYDDLHVEQQTPPKPKSRTVKGVRVTETNVPASVLNSVKARSGFLSKGQRG